MFLDGRFISWKCVYLMDSLFGRSLSNWKWVDLLETVVSTDGHFWNWVDIPEPVGWKDGSVPGSGSIIWDPLVVGGLST